MVERDVWFNLVAIIVSIIIAATIALSYLQLVEIKESERAENLIAECNYCHNMNMTYLVCSGFCAEPLNNDLMEQQGHCAIHPQENCKNISHEFSLLSPVF